MLRAAKAIEPEAGCDLWEAKIGVRVHKRRERLTMAPRHFLQSRFPGWVLELRTPSFRGWERALNFRRLVGVGCPNKNWHI
jgi:hypothetical protein